MLAGTSVVASGPVARENAGFATDPSGHVVLFGGQTESFHALGDTWTLNGSAWTERHPPVSPSPRLAMFMAYDPGRQLVVLFGGTNLNRSFDDTWTWDGSAWTEQHPATSPPAQCCSGMAYDAGTQRLVLFDGADTWTWDGSNWTKEHPSNSPPGRLFAAIASSGAHVVLNGGGSCLEECSYARDTWNWSGATWVNRHPSTGPHARWNAAVAYDMTAGETVLFGGSNENSYTYYFGDTWSWDGTDWTRQRPVSSPSKRERAAVAYDATSGVLVLFGGVGSRYFADTWTWNGTTWACVAGC